MVNNEQLAVSNNRKPKMCITTTTPNNLRTFALAAAKYYHEVEGWDITFVCDDDGRFGDELPDYIKFYPIAMKRGITLTGVVALFKYLRLFKREKFDLVQYSTPNASLYSSIAGFISRVPIRLYCQWGIVYSAKAGLFRKILKTEEKLVCSLSTWIEPDSKGNLVFSHNEGLYPVTKGTVIWNGSACGVDLCKFDIAKKKQHREKIRKTLGISDDSFVVGFVGRITKDKGVNELLSAFRMLLDKNLEMHLIMVGDFDPNPRLSDDLIEWSLREPRIHYTGWTNSSEEYFSSMDVFVLPSYREGFGLVTIEAEAMGIPVIVTDIPGPTEAIIEGLTGLVIPVNDAEALVNAISQLHDNTELRNNMGENAFLFARERFDQKVFFEYLVRDRKELFRKAGILNSEEKNNAIIDGPIQ